MQFARRRLIGSGFSELFMVFRRFFALATIASLPLACSDQSPTQPVSIGVDSASASPQAASAAGRPATRSLPARNLAADGMIGTWGGQQVTITIGAASAIISYPCAYGTIDQPFVADTKGNFDLVGTHVPESPGPIHPGDPVVHPARYTGTVDGKTMTFTVTETDIGEKLGPFVLTLGVASRIFRCY
jgi:hypothetical protein